jgi:hypothetical protein
MECLVVMLCSVSMVTAFLMHVYIELPCINYGKRILVRYAAGKETNSEEVSI